MRVAAIYDIHSNLPALEAALRDLRETEVDQVVIGGDVVPGPMPRETLTRLLDLDLPTRFIHGNGDREVLARMAGTETDWYRSAPDAWRAPVRWSAQQLDPAHQRILAGWPATCRVVIDGLGEVLFCHATPQSDTTIFTRRTPEDRLLPLFENVDADLVVCGHTHLPFDRQIGRVRVVNAGSVGMPFGQPGAHWLLLGPTVAFKHTSYDLAAAADRIRATTYPQAEDFAARNILHPLPEDEALAMYARAEVT